ncbi:hypothetical protein, partial [Frankia sp. EI5c]|uniref:hypothetical protein n=1 Tax=Frankia sp. EI5c TaxID=683316 RepID=UPI0037BFB53E
EIEHGAELWKVDVLRDGTRHRFEVDALTGQARRVGDDRGRAGNGHGADDRPGDDRRGRSGDNG